MATLAVQNLIRSSEKAATYGAAAGGGDVVPNDGKTVIHVKNGSGAPITVTIAAQLASKDFGGELGVFTRSNIAVSVPAAGERFIGPFPTKAFNNASGQIAITYSAVTSLTLAALRFPV